MSHQVLTSRIHTLQSNMLSYALMLTSDAVSARSLAETAALTAEGMTAPEGAATSDSDLKSWLFSIMKEIYTKRYAPAHAASPVTAQPSTRGICLTAQALERPEGSVPAAQAARAIAQLSWLHRQAAILYFTGSTLAEIARATGLSLGRIRARMADTRSLLKMHLKASR